MRLSIHALVRAGTNGIAFVVIFVCAVGTGVAPTLADAVAPWWHVNIGSRPTILAPSDEGTIVASVTNLGDGEADGPVAVTDTLPPGVTATTATYLGGYDGSYGKGVCPISGSKILCSVEGPLPAYQRLEIRIDVNIENDFLGTALIDKVNVSGGGAPGVSASESLPVDGRQTPFGIEVFEVEPEGADGLVDTQSGSHPFQLTSTVVLNAGSETSDDGEFNLGNEIGEVAQPALPRDLRFDLPPGLVGNPSPFPQCTETEFELEKCSVGAQLGVAVVAVANPLHGTLVVPVF